MRGRRWMMAVAAAVLTAAVPTAGGCGGDDADDAIIEQDPGLDDAKADSSSSTSTYYRARFDARKCMFPLCGGVWVRRVNFATTKCLDGKYAPECYAAVVELQGLGLGSTYLDEKVMTGFESGAVVLRGKLAAGKVGSFPITRFIAKEAWLTASAGEPATGDLFYRASDSGIRCIKAPCPSVHVAKLNSTVALNVDGFDLAAVPGSDADRDAAGSDVMRVGLVLAAHTRQVPQQGKVAVASQAYRRVIAPGALCGPGTSAACGPAMQCCYPCGIPGCKHVCQAVETCPLLP
jgi:hypothetical protein